MDRTEFRASTSELLSETRSIDCNVSREMSKVTKVQFVARFLHLVVVVFVVDWVQRQSESDDCVNVALHGF